jgi:hypothetical protein
MAPSDSRPYPVAVIYSGRQSLRPDASDRRIQSGLSGSSQICRRPLSPLTPGSPSAAYARCFTDGVWFHLLWKADHCHWFHEAETGSLALRLTSLPSRAPTTWLPTPPPSKLHGERASAMISTFQLTRSTRLTLTEPEGTHSHLPRRQTVRCLGRNRGVRRGGLTPRDVSRILADDSATADSRELNSARGSSVSACKRWRELSGRKIRWQEKTAPRIGTRRM